MLCAHEHATAAISDPGDGSVERSSLSELLLESILAAWALTKYDLQLGQRAAFYLPNDQRAVVWIEAAKRLGVPYVAIAGGTSSHSVAERLGDTGASVLVTDDSLRILAQEALRAVRGARRLKKCSLASWTNRARI